jgi:ABC-type branched-subunit amino acid transport system substrate-binding protein
MEIPVTMYSWPRLGGTCLLVVLLLAAPLGGAPQQTPVAIGVLTPLTGPDAITGTSVLQATRVAINVANTAGGVHGRRLVLLSLDCGSPGGPPGLTRLIKERHPLALFDALCPLQTAALVRYAAEHAVMVLATTRLDGIPANADLLYISDLQTPAVVAIVRYAAEDLRVSRLAVLIDDRAAPQVPTTTLTEWATTFKARVVAVDRIPFSPSSVTPVALEQSRKDAQAALLIGGPGDMTDIVTALGAYSKAATPLKLLAWVGPITAEASVKALPGLPNNVVFPLYYRTSAQLTEILRRTGLPANGPTLYAFDIVSMWIAAARVASETTPTSVAHEFDRLRYRGLSGDLAAVHQSPGRILKEFSIVAWRESRLVPLVPEFLCVPLCPCWPWCPPK